MSGQDSPSGARMVADQIVSLLLDEAGRWTDFRGSATDALVSVALDAARWRSERDGSELPAPLRDPSVTSLALPDRPRELQREWLDAAESDAARAEYLLTLTHQLGDRGRMFEWLSSDSMRQVANVAATAGLREGGGSFRILDIAAGSGSMLFSVAEAAARLGYDPQPLAVELNPRIAAVAAATFYLSGRAAVVQVADSLMDDPFAATYVDLAISQPPFGLGWASAAADVERCHEEGWYQFGLPPRSDSTWLFASRLIEKLTPADAGGGRAITFVTPAALRSPSTSGIRERLLEEDLLETIVALPRGLTPAKISVFAVVFNTAKPTRRKGRIQLIDLRALSETSRLTEAPRRLRPGALDTLQQAMQSTRDGVISRTVGYDYFMKVRRVVHVRGDTAPGNAPASLSWNVDLPRHSDLTSEMRDRYGPVEVAVDDADQTRCDLDIESVFDVGARSLRAWTERTGWPVTRLSVLLTTAPTTIGKSADVGVLSGGNVFLPTTPTDLASTGSPLDGENGGPARRLALQLDGTKVLPEFVVGWLNSPLGVDVRTRAQTTASSGMINHAIGTEPRTLLRFCDEIVVPLPPLAVQRDFAAAEARIVTAAGLVAAAMREAWSEPANIVEVRRRLDPLFDRSLTAWVAGLPYPVGSALWAFETKRQNPDAAHRQAFLVWEAYAAFFAAVLISALVQDPVIREAELPLLRQALADLGLDMTRATFGTWSVIVQRLAGRFRRRLRGDDADDRAALLQTFGGVSAGALVRILDGKIVDLITDANSKRNAWTGHSGSVSPAEMESQIGYLSDRMEELRELVGDAWQELQCVRAGDASMRHGQVIQKVELVVGANAPFRQTEITVGQMMEHGELYLCADGAAQPLKLQHLVVLRGSPSSARYTCYFYNSRDLNGVRLVTYQLADKSSVTEDAADFADAIDGLIAAESSDPAAP